MHRHDVNVLGYKYIAFDGYGKFGLNLVRALVGAGVNVYPLVRSDLDLPPTLQYLRGVDHSRLTIALMPPNHLPELHGRVWLYTMTEGYHISDKWASYCNRCERIIVPSPWLVEVFQRGGVTVPIHVIPGGIDPAEFSPQPPMPNHRPFVFLAFGDRGGRKADSEVWDAFTRAFATITPEQFTAWWTEHHTIPDAGWRIDGKLLVKVLPVNLAEFYGGGQSMYQTLSGLVDSMRHVYSLADCVVTPSRGEGWGFFGREAAAMGRPTIVGNWTGYAPDCEQWATVALKKSRIVETPKSDLGWWHTADRDELAEAMAWVYDNHAEAIEKARAGAEWLHQNQTWAHTAQALIELMETYA